MNLFYADGTISIAPAIALIEAGLEHDLTRIDFATAEQTKPEYLVVNPKGRVPALVLKDGVILSETGALLDYIAALAPNASLIPSAPANTAATYKNYLPNAPNEFIFANFVQQLSC